MMKKSIPCLLAASLFFGGMTTSNSAPLYWGQGTYPDSWATASNWYTDAAGTNVSANSPSAADDVYFNTTPNNTLGGVINMVNTEVNSLNYNTSGTTTLHQNGSTKLLTIGGGGVIKGVGSGQLTLGVSTHSLQVNFLTSQTWTNNSDTMLQIRNAARVSDSATAPVVVTFNAAGAGSITASGNLADGTTHSFGLIVDSQGTGAVNLSNSTFSGGAEIRRGLLVANGDIGTQGVLLGDTSGNDAATIRLNAASMINEITVQAGNGGNNFLQTVRDGDATLSGDIILDNDLTVQTRASRNGILNGSISGSGNLTKDQYNGGNGGALILGGGNTYGGNTIVNAGTLVLADGGALTFYIGADGVNNGISGTGTLNLEGEFIFDLSGAVAVGGNSWQIIDVASLNETFGASFAVQGFNESANIWTMGGYTFEESTGILSYNVIPEPSTLLLLAGGLTIVTVFRRRRGV